MNILNIDTNIEDNGYDLNDNRLSRQQGTGTEELDEWINLIDNSNRIAQIDTFQRGAILPDLPDREMIYNDAGRLYQLIEEGNLKASYIYNDMGQRTRKTIYQADGATVDNVTIYHYDQMGMLVTETTETGVLMKNYIWNGGMIAAQITNTVSLDESNTESIVYLYTDHLMTNRLATEDTQQVVWRWEGEAFGNTPAEELGGVSVNLRFPGQYFDAETNLHYNHFRYYDPTIGRYITSDPIGLRGGVNAYGYVLQNPIRFSDPLGLYFGEEYVGYVVDAIGGADDFIDNYKDMRDADTRGADKYFHCKANCEASQRGEGGEDMACIISDTREWSDENLKRDPPSASAADQIANQFGRSNGVANPNSDCSIICAHFRPLGLDPKY